MSPIIVLLLASGTAAVRTNAPGKRQRSADPSGPEAQAKLQKTAAGVGEAAFNPNTPFGTPYADECPALKMHNVALSDLPTDELRIVSWNVEWGFSPRSKRVKWLKEVVEPRNDTSVLRCPQDMFDQDQITRPFKRSHPCHSRDAMEHHLHLLSEKLASLQPRPHIVNLAELDGCAAAADVGSGLAGYRPYVVYGDDDRTTEQVGFLSAMPPTGPLRRFSGTSQTPVPGNEAHCNVPMGDQGFSKHYIAKFDIPGKLRFYLVGVHLKSMRQEQVGQACSIREAEAAVLDRILKELHKEDPGAEVLVMGDFNDFDPEVPDRRGAFYSKIHRSEIPPYGINGCVPGANGTREPGWVVDEGILGQHSRVFEIVKGTGSGRPRLENLMGKVPRERRYSHKGAPFTAFASVCGVSRWYGDKDCGVPRPQSRLDPRTMDSRDCSGDTLLDYMMATPRLAAVVKDVRVLNDEDFGIAYSPDTPFKKAYYYDAIGLTRNRAVRDENPRANGFNPSDHFPVSLTIDLTKL